MNRESSVAIEDKGVVFNIQSYSIHDGPGIRTVVFLKGCPLSCIWCSNPESQSPLPELGVSATLCKLCRTCVDRCPAHAVSLLQDGSVFTDRTICVRCGQCEDFCPHNARKLYGTSYSIDQLITRIEKDMPFFTRSGGGVTFSGGEPTIQFGFLLGALKQCKNRFIHTAIETCGHIREREKLEALVPYVDLFLYDIKCVDSEKHLRYTGVSNELILKNAQLIAESGGDMVIRIPLIPGFNDSGDEIGRIAEFVLSLKSVKQVNLLPYHELGKSKYRMLDKEYKLDDEEGVPESFVSVLQRMIESFGLQCSID